MSAVQQQNEPTALYLHAELLPNIRHITLYVSLSEAIRSQDVRPEICLSDSRRGITVSLPLPYDHATDTIKLPARVNEASRLALSVAGQRAMDPRNRGHDQQEYSFRMQVDDEDDSLLSREEHMDSFVPWTATDMTSCSRLRCRHCKNIVLDSYVPCGSGAGEKDMQGWMWKDLPSGNWAEMMDFWHCHKPDPHEGHDHHANDATAEDQNATVKGYGAANQVVATAGTVLVDVATFLLTDSDCRGLKQVSTDISSCWFSSGIVFVVPFAHHPRSLYFNPTLMHDLGKKRRRPFHNHALVFDTIALQLVRLGFYFDQTFVIEFEWHHGPVQLSSP